MSGMPFLSRCFWFHDIIIGIIWTERSLLCDLWWLCVKVNWCFSKWYKRHSILGGFCILNITDHLTLHPCGFLFLSVRLTASSWELANKELCSHWVLCFKPCTFFFLNMMHIDLIACIMGFFFFLSRWGPPRSSQKSKQSDPHAELWKPFFLCCLQKLL